MPVGIDGHLNRRVAHLFLDIIRVLVLGYDQRGASVPEIVEPYSPELRFFENRVLAMFQSLQ